MVNANAYHSILSLAFGLNVIPEEHEVLPAAQSLGWPPLVGLFTLLIIHLFFHVPELIPDVLKPLLQDTGCDNTNMEIDFITCLFRYIVKIFRKLLHIILLIYVLTRISKSVLCKGPCLVPQVAVCVVFVGPLPQYGIAFHLFRHPVLHFLMKLNPVPVHKSGSWCWCSGIGSG